MKKRILIIGILVCTATLINAQNADFKLQNYHPASPSTFQFQKYVEMPVSEYTGVPNISIPIYQIEEDGVTVPINLTYHAAGIRVSQEASWVGLGWDMNFGSIVQEINDRDDYGISTIRKQPDWNESPIPSLYSQIYYNYSAKLLSPGYNDPVPIVPCKGVYSYRIYTAYSNSINYYPNPDALPIYYYYLPIDGNRTNQPASTDVVSDPNYDSEPDVFTANFFEHSIKYIRDPKSNLIIVLNKQGYKVSRDGSNFIIIVPSGDTYYFEINSEINSHSSTIGGMGGSGSTPTLPSSKLWMITKIVTRNKREIVFNYSSSGIVNNYPNYSEKYNTSISSTSNTYVTEDVEGYYQYIIEGIGKTYNYSSETRYILNSIVFPNGEIDFITSSRDDILGGKKLDQIQIKSQKILKAYQLNYSYFNSSTVGGNRFQPDLTGNYGNPDLRLKLLTISDNSGAVHSFTYDATSLPGKNSLAQDFWGFYNGQLNNTTIIPNPARLNLEQLAGLTSLPNNGSNNSANLNFTKAGTLTQIKYPTGGYVKFDYELNQFDNYWVPDFSTTSNQISSGNGLRIRAINYQAVDNINSKQTTYTYSIGKAVVPLKFTRIFGVNSISAYKTDISPGQYTMYQVAELNGKGFYSTNSLGSGNSVGYDKVVKADIGLNGVSLGRTETTYFNIPDDITSSANSSTEVCAALPAKRHLYDSENKLNPENGSIKSVSIYNSQNKIVRKIDNTYLVFLSDIYYGARLFGYATLYYQNGSVPRCLTGYYPIYDIETLLDKSITTETDENNNSLISTVSYGYDGYHQLSGKYSRTSTDGYVNETYDHAYEYYQKTGDNSLWSNNILTEITGAQIVNRNSNYYESFNVSKYDHEYQVLGNKILRKKTTSISQPGPNEISKVITYDQYDTYGNLTQYSTENAVNSLIWGYSGKYVIAEINNAKANEIFYNGFEEGGWDNNLTTYDNSNTHTGSYSGRIDKITVGEQYSHSSTWLNVNLTSVTKFKYSGWVYSNGPSVQIYLIMKKAGETAYSTYNDNVFTDVIGKWVYLEKEYSVPADVTQLNIRIDNNGGGTVWFDDIRLHPSSAFMTSYTYDPLVGLTSKADVNDRVNYYEYDPSGRLYLIRDQNKKILQKFCYNYAGQPEVCGTNPLWLSTGITRCKPCPTNSNYISNVLQHQEKDNNAQSITYNTLRWVDDGVSSSCVPQADWQLQSFTCQLNASGQNTGTQVRTEKDMNPCSPTYNTTRVVNLYNTTACPLPVSCTTSNCSGIDRKCVNGVCEVGCRVNTSSVYTKINNPAGDPPQIWVWRCTYHYVWSDGSVSPNYTEDNQTSCSTTNNCLNPI